MKSETFEHMLTVIMIMFGDARESEFENVVVSETPGNEKLEREAFEYAESWLAPYIYPPSNKLLGEKTL